MIRYRAQSTVPNLSVRIEGELTADDLTRTLRDAQEDLACLTPGFVFLANLHRLTGIHLEAEGRLFYWIARVLEADPALMVVVNGGRVAHYGLRTFIRQLDGEHRLLTVASQAEADRVLRAFQIGANLPARGNRNGSVGRGERHPSPPNR